MPPPVWAAYPAVMSRLPVRVSASWLIVVGVASVLGAVATFGTTPAREDLFDSPALVPTLAILTVLCGFAGGFVPRWGPIWGLVPVLPYLGALAVQVNDPATIGGEFAPIGFGLLLVVLGVPWLAGFTVALARKQVRPPSTQRSGASTK